MWEYQFRWVHCSDYYGEFDPDKYESSLEALNQCGSEGWEAVQMLVDRHDQPESREGYLIVMLRRRLRE